MTRSRPPAPPWLALFAPLPPDAVPRRGPIVPPDVLAKPEAAALAGWEQLTLELLAGGEGTRIVQVVLDGAGVPVSASDWVMTRTEATEDGRPVVHAVHDNVGGRLEPDGTFRGTRWHTHAVLDADDREVRKTATPSPPSAADVAALQATVAELLRRAPVKQ